MSSSFQWVTYLWVARILLLTHWSNHIYNFMTLYLSHCCTKCPRHPWFCCFIKVWSSSPVFLSRFYQTQNIFGEHRFIKWLIIVHFSRISISHRQTLVGWPQSNRNTIKPHNAHNKLTLWANVIFKCNFPQNHIVWFWRHRLSSKNLLYSWLKGVHVACYELLTQVHVQGSLRSKHLMSIVHRGTRSHATSHPHSHKDIYSLSEHPHTGDTQDVWSPKRSSQGPFFFPRPSPRQLTDIPLSLWGSPKPTLSGVNVCMCALDWH